MLKSLRWFRLLQECGIFCWLFFINVLKYKSKFYFPSRRRLFLALKLTTRIIGSDDMAEIKLELGRGGKKLCNINNVVTIINDITNFCCLDLKCSIMYCFATFC